MIKLGIAQPAVVSRTRRVLSTRMSSGHVVMLLAGALGVLLTLSVLRTAQTTQPVVVASHELAPGTVIGAGDVRVTRIHADREVLGSLISGRELESTRGQIVTKVVPSGSLVAHDAVRPATDRAATRVMSFPIARSRAVGGKITSGDRVDIVAVERNTGAAGYVLTDAEVTGVDAHSSGPLAGSSDDLTVSLAVTPRDAPRLAGALEVGTVTLVRSTGAAALRDAEPFEPAGSK